MTKLNPNVDQISQENDFQQPLKKWNGGPPNSSM